MFIFKDKIRKSLVGGQHIHLPGPSESHPEPPLRLPALVLSGYKRGTKTLCVCQGSTNVESVTSRVKNNWKLFLFKMELKQYFVMTRSCHNCLN